MQELFEASSIMLAFSISKQEKFNSYKVFCGRSEFTPKPVCWPHICNAAIASVQAFTAVSAFMDYQGPRLMLSSMEPFP